ncbi:LysR family transcriptional regulator [Brevibacillus agri]|uniref:LysR family transcriptional regulator n=1 Tax=Brevibacillus agri TaxID=51101 RepID=UPI001EE568F5|nr:LysR family transcriptional regulator [Brevibacillus agri]MCG5253464.1 LysR family transcriptional regulator [Brevibacillus agri]
MEYRDWSILQTLYREQNITRTAKSLYLSQPALTKRLRQIEKEFGVQIVQRGRRGVHFTPEGEYLASCADEMLLRLRKIKEHVANMGEQVSGTLRLGVSNYFAHYKLPGLLKLFKQEYPLVEFKVGPDGKLLLFEESVCIVSKDPVDVADLPSLPRIDYKTDPLLQALVDSWWAENYSSPPRIGMEVDKADTCGEMVANGLGYAILPRLVANGKQNLYLIEIKDAANKPVKRSTWMFYHKASLELQNVRAFVNFMQRMDFPHSY